MARVCALLSGGKDSNYALYLSLVRGDEVACILAVKPRRRDSWMFHTAALEAPRLQAEAMGLSHAYREAVVSGVREREVEELKAVLTRLRSETGFDTIVLGGIASRYQLERARMLALHVGAGVYAPLWGVDPEEHLLNLVRSGFKFVISRASTMGLGAEYVGRVFDEDLAREVIALSRRYGFNPAFEGGEAETLVLDAPHYRMGLCVRGRVARLPGGVYELVVEGMRLCSEARVELEQA
ncbi:conserved hypothetical protein [Aeropyrum pernix]|uniref:Diphthamide synthase domain-containing protein n=1 Tax=Aeropyrum pernix TaxID=56636 RepID=A0A401HAE3_AERPX|nr:diphthine--ammonia ligase [Aeropyrum pernix]GBF09322.1 conserved hypothetical protein [Aeropyrum pernix]